MPKLPQSSPFITDVHTANLSIPPDAIVVRGYLGPPRGVLEHAAAILAAFGKGIPAGHITTVNNFNGMTPPPPGEQEPEPPKGVDLKKLHWRIYLTARLDCWIEVPDWGTNVVHVRQENNTDRRDAYTVWLRRFTDDATRSRIHYRVVSAWSLERDDSFVAGRLVEDYMARGESSSPVWEEQEYGFLPTAASSKHCR